MIIIHRIDDFLSELFPKIKEITPNSEAFPGKQFSGVQLLAYMYVAWKEIDPSKDLEINFRSELEQAKKIFNNKYLIKT